MLRSPTGHGFWMPASIAGDTWPDVLATTLAVSERRIFVATPQAVTLEAPSAATVHKPRRSATLFVSAP